MQVFYLFKHNLIVVLESNYEWNMKEDTQMLQNDSLKLYKLVDANNMKLNDTKFELLRYGKEQEIKTAITQKSYDGSNIDNKEQVRG